MWWCYFAIVFVFDMGEQGGVAEIGLAAGANELSGLDC